MRGSSHVFAVALLLASQLASLCDGLPTAYFTLIVNRTVLQPGRFAQVTVNGSVPGPVLRVQPGQNVSVTVINALAHEATTVHWHGMMQRGTPYADGVPGATQCVISNQAGHEAMTYSFSVPPTAGTFWYHGHYSEQYIDGLYGALVVSDAADDAALAAGALAGVGNHRALAAHC